MFYNIDLVLANIIAANESILNVISNNIALQIPEAGSIKTFIASATESFYVESDQEEEFYHLADTETQSFEASS